MSMVMDTQITVGQLVAQRPSRSRIFQKHGIDFCCGGKKTLEQASREKGLDPRQILEEIQQSDASPRESGIDWTAAPLAKLCDHIESTHHEYLRQELPRLGFMAEKVATVHGAHHPWTVELHQVFEGLAAELNAHMMKEEQVLFPLIREMEATGGRHCHHCGSVANPIRVMEHEHDQAGAALARMNELSSGYQPPADACNTFRALLDGLAHLEADMHQHVHKENNILFPRAAQLEQQAR